MADTSKKRAKSRSRVGYVYFIGTEHGPIKIGWSANPRSRLAALQIHQAEPLILFCATPGSLQEEACLHELFKADRMMGEWFRRSPELEAEIERLRAHEIASGRSPDSPKTKQSIHSKLLLEHFEQCDEERRAIDRARSLTAIFEHGHVSGPTLEMVKWSIKATERGTARPLDVAVFHFMHTAILDDYVERVPEDRRILSARFWDLQQAPEIAVRFGVDPKTVFEKVRKFLDFAVCYFREALAEHLAQQRGAEWLQRRHTNPAA